MMRLEQAGFAPLTIADGGVDDANFGAGTVTFIGSYGTFFLNVSTALSIPTGALDLNTRNMTSSGGTLVITVADTDYNLPTGNPLTLMSDIGGNLSRSGSQLTFQSWANPNNLSPLPALPTAIPVGSVTPGPLDLSFQGTGTAFEGTATVPFERGAGPYSLFAQATIQFASDGNVGFDAFTSVVGEPQVTIGNYVWHDVNADGKQDAGEPGIPNVTLHLYDSTNTLVDTKVTGSNGEYLFIRPPGAYTVKVDTSTLPPGFVPTTINAPGTTEADDSNPNPSGTTPASLPDGSSDLTLDFGYYKLAALGDFVWEDKNANGVQESGEPGISGVTVNLLNSGGSVIATTTTDSGGKYLFSNLVPGTYSVEFVKPSGYTASPKDVGSDGTDSDADIVTGKTGPYTLASGQTDLTVDAGYYKTVSVGNFVWHDQDADGIQDASEPGINGVTLTLTGTTGSGGSVTQTTTTSGNGAYLFSGLAPGTYTVTVDAANFTGSGALVGYNVSATVVGTDRAVDSNVSPSGTSPAALPGGTSDLTLDFGYHKLAALGDYVWEDTNANGVQESGEPGISGVTVKLLNAGGTVIATTTTNSSGKYLFNNLVPGTYSVEFVKPSGYTASPKDQGSDDAKDSDADVSTGKTGSYTLVSGQTDLTVDAGYYKTVSVGNFVWHDQDADGIQDASEPGINGVTLTLTGTTGSGGSVTATATTAGNGAYLFSGLAPGTYTVTVDAANFTGSGALVGYTASATVVGTDRTVDSNVSPSGTSPAALPGGSSDLTLDFGYYKPALGRISGTKYRDVSGNGLNVTAGPYSPADVPLAGTVVYLDKNNNGSMNTGEPSTTTNANGYYEFTGLTPGTYYVREVVPTGWLRTGPALADFHKVVVSGGTNSTCNDFANYEMVCAPCTFTNVSFKIVHVDGTSEVVSNLRGQTQEGDRITVTFWVDEPGSYLVSFVSYTAPGKDFDAGTASQQKIYDVDQGTFAEGGPYTLTISVPNSYYQVDFVCGDVISQLGPAGSNIFYTPQDRLFSADNGGTHARLTTPASISGVKYNDLNGDGDRDSNEPGLKDWVIYVDTNGDGDRDGTEPATVTMADGSYKISNLPSGNYGGKVKEVMQTGWVQKQAPGAFSLAAGQDKTGVNFGNHYAATSTVSGYKYNDRNADGEWDKNGLDNCWGNADDEVGLSGWKIFVDYDGDGVHDSNEPSDLTDSNGYYKITGVKAGTWAVDEVMQSGWVRTTADRCVTLSGSGSATNVNFGNFCGNLVMRGDTAAVAFWKGTNGQKLIKKLNDGGTSGSAKALGNWLASNFANLYGSSAGSNKLAGKTNAQVAAYFCSLVNDSGKQLEAQVLATILSVYVTDCDWAGGTYAAAYGFTVTSVGVKNDHWNVGDNGAAFGVANDSALTVWDLLQRTNARASNGTLWAGCSSSIKTQAKNVFCGINAAGGINS